MKPKIRRAIVFIFFFALLIIFAFPFKVESIHSTVYLNMFGRSQRPYPQVIYHSGYKETYVLALQFFFYLALIFLFWGKKKVWGIFSIISSVINGLSLIVVYLAVTFHIHFYGPHKTMEAGIGFYLLTLLSALLIFFSFYTYQILPKSARSSGNKDLLDSDL